MVANHWFVGQLAANVMLTIAIIILISRERTRKNVRAVLGFCFFALAILGRNHIVFTFPFFLYLVISDDSFRLEGPGHFIRRYLKAIRDNYVLVLLVCLPVITIIFMIALYNYLRFDDFLFKGIELSNMRRTSRELTDQHGLVNFKYLFRNIYVTLLRPPGAGLIDGFYRDEGFSIFLQSSFLLSIFFVRSTPFSKDFLIAGLIGVSCCSLFVLFWVGSGYRQFGARYLFDSFPVLMAILIFAEPRIKNRMLLALTMISILLNVFGCFYFTNSFRQYNLF